MSKKPIRRRQPPAEEKNQIEDLVIRNRIETIKKQRDSFITQANQQIAHLNGQIAALEALLPENQPKEEPGAEPKEKAPTGEPPTGA